MWVDRGRISPTKIPKQVSKLKLIWIITGNSDLWNISPTNVDSRPDFHLISYINIIHSSTSGTGNIIVINQTANILTPANDQGLLANQVKAVYCTGWQSQYMGRMIRIKLLFLRHCRHLAGHRNCTNLISVLTGVPVTTQAVKTSGYAISISSSPTALPYMEQPLCRPYHFPLPGQCQWKSRSCFTALSTCPDTSSEVKWIHNCFSYTVQTASKTGCG